MVAEDQQHFWLVRSHSGAMEVPVLDKEVAETFRAAGWEATELNRAALEEDDLRCLRTPKGRGSGGCER
jgi:hypothetical protein